MRFFIDIGYVHDSMESMCGFVVLKYFIYPVRCGLDHWVLVQLSTMFSTLLRNDQSKNTAIFLQCISFRISVTSYMSRINNFSLSLKVTAWGKWWLGNSTYSLISYVLYVSQGWMLCPVISLELYICITAWLHVTLYTHVLWRQIDISPRVTRMWVSQLHRYFRYSQRN